jgi:hypothetical protein
MTLNAIFLITPPPPFTQKHNFPIFATHCSILIDEQRNLSIKYGVSALQPRRGTLFIEKSTIGTGSGGASCFVMTLNAIFLITPPTPFTQKHNFPIFAVHLTLFAAVSMNLWQSTTHYSTIVTQQ